MKLLPAKTDIIQQLQKEIQTLQGYSTVAEEQRIQTGLGIIEHAFPDKCFPTGAIHELLSSGPEAAAATTGFISGLLHCLMQAQGTCLWISTRRTIFPPALRAFGLSPERITFIDVHREKDALWAIEEALKCNALAAVVGELKEVSFTESRRLQLAVERSHLTGFIHRYRPRTENTTAFFTRWKISPLASMLEEGLPGVGFPKWHVHLQRVRNGKPCSWHVVWTTEGFKLIPLFTPAVSRHSLLKTA